MLLPMSELGRSSASRGWHRRFVEHIDSGERLGELLFGLIMVLTFTLGAGIELQGDRTATRELLFAAFGCNVAWGILDAVLLLLSRLSERDRLHRIVKRVHAAERREQALATPLAPTRVTAWDLWAGGAPCSGW